jgi:opacity protein-like surface antigen
MATMILISKELSSFLIHRSKRTFWAAVFVSVISFQAQAAEWTAEPRISLLSGYNDNYLLTTQPHSSVWEADLIASSKFGVAKENQGLFGNAKIVAKRFWGGSGQESSDLLDREDYFFNADAYHQSERNVFRGNIDYIRDSTTDYEVEEGITTNVYATRILKKAGASWARTLTERMSVDLGYQYNNTSFADDPGDSDLTPYKFNVLTASLNYQITPRTTGILQGAGSSYKPDTNFNSNTWNLQAGLSSAFTETIDGSILAGYRKTTSDTLFFTGFCIGANPGASFPDCDGGIPVRTGSEKGETKTNGTVYSASVSKRLEKGLLSATLSRTATPNLNGQLLDSTKLRLNGIYRLTEMLTSRLSIQYSENEAIVSEAGRDSNDALIQEQFNRKQKSFSITPRISWRFLREWRLAGEYQYVKNKNRLQNTASRNAVYLTLSYVPTKFSISR